MQPDADPAEEVGRTAVVFVHGMGSQKRLGDLSYLVEVLDHRASLTERGRLRGIDVKLEPALPADAPVTYVEATWLPIDPVTTTKTDFKVVRFYEAYWAPIAAIGVPKWQVVRWMFSQVLKPVGALRAPWRDRARLRRSVLASMEQVPDATRQTLFQAYDDFDGDDARRRFPKGGLSEFQQLVANENENSESLRQVIASWHSAYRWSEIRNLALLLTLAVAILSLAGLALLTLIQLVAVLDGSNPLEFDLGETASFAADHREVLLLLVGTLIAVIPIGGFLESYLGDVQMWATYEETNVRYRMRKDIMETTCKLIRHVVDNEKVSRVVVVSHSLGTAIAMDSLLRLARDARAVSSFDKDLRKITHFVTYGSPIDKIHYLFEESGQRGHRYNRIVEDLRGDVGTAPFGQNGKRYMHWINFWDRADLIAGPLETPCNRRHPELRIDNVQVHGSLLPGGAHTGYLHQDEVADALIDVIFFRNSGRNDATHADDSPDVGPGHDSRWVSFVHLTAGVVVWALALWLVSVAIADRMDLAVWTAIGLGLAVGLVQTIAKLRRR